MFFNAVLRWLAWVSLICSCGWVNVAHGQSAAAEPPLTSFEFADEELGVQLTLPSNAWKKTDHSQGLVKVYVFAEDEHLLTRCSVFYFSKVFLPNGILTREEQLKAILKDRYERISLDDVTFADQPARRLVFRASKSKTVAWELDAGDSYLIFQLSALDSSWKDRKTKKELENIRDAFRFTGVSKKEVLPVSVPSPEEIRRLRQATVTSDDAPFEVLHHELHVRIEPVRHSLKVRDHITVRALSDDLEEIGLYISEMNVQEVATEVDIDWEMQKRDGGPCEDATVEIIQVTFAEPLSKNQEIRLDIDADSDDFLHEIGRQLVAEIAVLGQVRDHSSYSSHVIYYPVDAQKGGSVDITLNVPKGLTAVSGGELVSLKITDGRSEFRYQTADRRPRLLPFGFAVGRYIQQSGTSAAGLQLTVYGYPGEEKLIDQRVTAGVAAANVFEKLMGCLPWKDVRFAHVTPHRKETGVSLPGLILISDAFFTDFEDVDASDGNLANPDLLSLLVVADEISHQWNGWFPGSRNRFFGDSQARPEVVF